MTYLCNALKDDKTLAVDVTIVALKINVYDKLEVEVKLPFSSQMRWYK